MATYSSKKYPAGSVTSAQLADGTVVAVDLADGAITSAKLNSTVDLSGKTVTYRSIVAGDIASNAITTAKISDAAVSHTKMANAGAELGMRNRIINGAMGIWQRGTTYTGTAAPSVSQFGAADRWAFGQFPTAYTAARSTDVPSGSIFQYSLKIQRTAGQTTTNQASIIQAIESVNMYDLAGQSVTLSFWAKCGANFSMASSAMGVILTTGTAADQGSYASQGGWTGQAYPVNSTQVLTTSWQRFTFTGTIGAGALEAAVYFYMVGAGTAGADDSIFITGVQLEKGSTATPFDYRSIGTELALCQRYFNIYRGGTYGNFQIYGSVFSFGISVPVPMRTQPTFVTNITDTNFAGAAAPNSNQWAMYVQNSGWNVYSGSINTLSLNGASENSTNYSLGTYGCTLGSGFTGFLLGSNLYFSFNAEL